MPRPRIFITYPFPLGRATGGARMSREIARHLGRAGADVTVFPVSASPATCFPRPAVERAGLGFEFDEELARDSVTVQRVAQHRLHWVLDGAAVKKALVPALAAHKPDAVLSYYHEASFLPSLLEPMGIRFGFISTWQSYERAMNAPLAKVPKPLWSWVNQKVVIEPHRRASVFFATSSFTRQELIDHIGVPAERIVVCPLGVAPHFFDIPAQEPERIHNLLFFGRVIPSKGVRDALAALGTLAQRGHTDWTFRIVGLGKHDWAAAVATEFGIEDKVEIHGPMDDQALARELARADLAILPSHFEAFGLCFAEAQAAAVPVIAYDAGSVPEIVEHGQTGWLAPLQDVDALAGCIEQALADTRQTWQAGLAGRQRVAARFTWENTAATILAGVQR